MLNDGVYSINEVRSKEGLSPVTGGDEHHIQLNQIPLSKMDEYAEQVVASDPEPQESGNGGKDNEAIKGVDNQMKESGDE